MKLFNIGLINFGLFSDMKTSETKGTGSKRSD
jgi:hypothetical protein